MEYFNSVVGGRRWIGKLDLSRPTAEAAIVDVVEGVPILGQVDMVIPLQGSLGIVELKTTGGNRFAVIHEHELMQAAIYCVMMRRLGYNCSNAFVVKVIRGGTSFNLMREADSLASRLSSMSPGQAIRMGGDVAIKGAKIDEATIMRDIERAMEYWLYKRNPTHNNSPSNCSHCDYWNSCPFSTARGMHH